MPEITTTVAPNGLPVHRIRVPGTRALTALESLDVRAYRVVEMRYFAGLTEEDIAGVLEVSVPTVKRDWRKARAFLYGQLC